MTSSALLVLLFAWPVSAQQVDTPVSVLVCVPDSSLSASVAPCPASPLAAPQVVSSAVLLSQSDYQNLLAYDGPFDQSEAVNLALTCAGTVVALYLVALGVGTVVGFIRRA